MGFHQANHFAHSPKQAYLCNISKIVLSFLLLPLPHQIAKIPDQGWESNQSQYQLKTIQRIQIRVSHGSTQQSITKQVATQWI